MPLLGRTVDYLSLLEAYIAPSCAMKASLQEKAFMSLPAHESLGSESEVSSVFSSRGFPSTCVG